MSLQRIEEARRSAACTASLIAAVLGRSTLVAGLLLGCASATARAQFVATNLDCAGLLQAQDARAVSTCAGLVDEAERAPAVERLPRIIANDNYGVALLGVAHKPQQSLRPFDRAVTLLPQSTVKPNTLQWAVVFWHRATAYQQLQQWQRAADDLKIAEDSLTRAIAAAAGDAGRTQHLAELRQRVSKQRAEVLLHADKRNG